MKKKILSFILSICLIIPCAFMMTACGQKPLDLAGKSIKLSSFEDDIELNLANPCFQAYYSDGSKEYTLSLTLGEFIEAFLETDIIEEMTDTSNITTMEDAKTAIIQATKIKVASNVPLLKFSDDGLSVVTYAATDTDFANPLETYSVERIDNGNNTYKYSLIKEALSGEIYANKQDEILCAGGIFGTSAEFDLPTSSEMITLTDVNTSETIQLPMSQCQLSWWCMLPGFLTYKVIA